MSGINALIQQVEDELARTYRFDLSASVCDYLLSEESALLHAPSHRAAVLVRHDPQGDELHLGLYLCRDIVEQIESQNPLQELTLDNLDAFCVLVEELSHFHLLANRASLSQQVSRLELEWQGEIDKVLVAGSFLLRQTGTPCFAQLAHLIFDRSSLLGHDPQIYEEASRFAAQHWYQFLHEVKRLRAGEQWAQARERFQTTYRLPWSDKLVQLRAR